MRNSGTQHVESRSTSKRPALLSSAATTKRSQLLPNAVHSGHAVYSRLRPSRAAAHCFSAAFCRLLSRTRGRSAFIRASASAGPLANPSAAMKQSSEDPGVTGREGRDDFNSS